MKILRFLPVLCAFICLPHGAVAQSSPIRSLQGLVGTWVGKAVFTDKRPPFNEPVDCLLKVTAAVHGHYYHCEYTMLVSEGPIEVLQMLTFSPHDELFESWSFNENSPGANLMTGTLDTTMNVAGKDVPFDATQYKPGKAGKLPELKLHLTMTGYPVVAQGETIKYREVFDFVSADEFLFTYSIRRGDTWSVMYATTYDRKKGS